METGPAGGRPERLADGRLLEIEVAGPDARSRGSVDRDEVFAFVAQPLAPWFSPQESAFLGALLRGDLPDPPSDWLTLGRVGGRLGGAVWHANDPARPELGVLGYVWTDPELRGVGIGGILTERAMARFRADGGRAMYLGTANPTAHRLYERAGFRTYNGIVMRALVDEVPGQDFDRAWFAPGSPTRMRDARPADVASFTALLACPEPGGWVVRDHHEGIFHAPPSVTASSCTRPFMSTWLRAAASPGGVFGMLETSAGRVVGAASATARAGPLRASATLEVTGHPSYRSDLAGLVSWVVRRAFERGATVIRAYADPGDRAELLEASGFAIEWRLPAELDLGERREDLLVYARRAD